MTRFLFIFFLFTQSAFAQKAVFKPSQKELDSMMRGLPDSRVALLYDSICGMYLNNDPAYSLRCADRSVKLFEEEESQPGRLAHALSNRSKSYRALSQFDNSLRDLDRAHTIYRELKDTSWLLSIYLDYGNLYYFTGEYKKAADNYLKAMRLSEAIGDEMTRALCQNNVGNIHLVQQQFDKAIESYRKSYRFYKEAGDTVRAALCLDNVGLVYVHLKQYEMAIMYQTSAMQTLESIKDPRKKDLKSLAEVTMNLGVTNLERKNFDTALNYFNKAYSIYDTLGSQWGLAGCLVNIGEVYLKQGDHAAAIEPLTRSVQISDSTGALSSKRDALSNLSDVYERLGDHKKALEYYRAYTVVKDSLLNAETSGQINEMNSRYEAEKREKTIELLEKDKNLGETRFRGIAAALGLTFILLLLIGYRFREKKRANKVLEERNEAIRKINEEIALKNREITDSINYAQRIQEAMLPSHRIFNEYFRDNFVIYLPKDIISGDFYWATRKGDQIFVAAADCTGHGVPGALMSMIGISFLRQIINELNITEPDAILTRLHQMVIEALNEDSDNRNSKDGMDISILRVDLLNMKVCFCGAARPLFHLSSGNLNVIKGDRLSVGGIKSLSESFAQQEIVVKKGDSFYMSSDGYADQFGEKTGKKFMAKNFQRLLERCAPLSMEEQKAVIVGEFSSWKGKNEQTDDVMVIGLKI